MSGYVIDLGLVAYREAHSLQLDFVDMRVAGSLDRDLFLVTEHPPVFTLGRRGNRSHLKVSDEFLRSHGVDVVHVERGGDITYHGIGQIVVYPVFNLRVAKLSVGQYISCLEEVMILTANDYGVNAERDPRNRGVWVAGNKLGSIGIAVRRGICFHGLALNVNVSLVPFGWMNPCGLEDIGVTSLAGECGKKVEIPGVRSCLITHLASVFKKNLIQTDLEELPGIADDENE